MKTTFESYGINHANYATRELDSKIKKSIIDKSKGWPVYFARLYPVASTNGYEGVNLFAVSHSGVRLVRREKTKSTDALVVVEHIPFKDIINIVQPTEHTVQLNYLNNSAVFYSHLAKRIKKFTDQFCMESDQENQFVIAVKDYITREATLLSFRKNDIITIVQSLEPLEQGWMRGSMNGLVGLFPAECVRSVDRQEQVQHASSAQHISSNNLYPSYRSDEECSTASSPQVHTNKYTLMEFANDSFRDSHSRYKYNGDIDDLQAGASAEGTWDQQAELVKWTKSPIQLSLLHLPPALNDLAVNCFVEIMKYMGDYPLSPNREDIACVMHILKVCHDNVSLRDEIYCQLMKQTTRNKSTKPKSATMGWRLMSIIAAYYDCSDNLRPYLLNYLQDVANDSTVKYSAFATICLQNLRKTINYQGRKNFPTKDELRAISSGRTSRRQRYYHAGASGGMLAVKAITVVDDAVKEISTRLGIRSAFEWDEYSLFVRLVQSRLFQHLEKEQYLMDVINELYSSGQEYDLVFQRTVWYYPLHSTDNDLYIDMMYGQVLPDFQDGFLLLNDKNFSSSEMEELSLLAALQYRVADKSTTASVIDLPRILPGSLVNGCGDRMKHSFLTLINDKLLALRSLSPQQCKIKFLNVLSRNPLFGSTFFLVKHASGIPTQCYLVVNKHGVQILDHTTRDVLKSYHLDEILSTRRVRSEGENILDMKVGNLLKSSNVYFHTDQSYDISSLIAQYKLVINQPKRRMDNL